MVMAYSMMLISHYIASETVTAKQMLWCPKQKLKRAFEHFALGLSMRGLEIQDLISHDSSRSCYFRIHVIYQTPLELTHSLHQYPTA